MINRDELSDVADSAISRHARRHHLVPFRDNGRTRVLRFWLNILFMVGAIAGMALYFTSYRETAVYILIAASIPKFVELTLRIMNL